MKLMIGTCAFAFALAASTFVHGAILGLGQSAPLFGTSIVTDPSLDGVVVAETSTTFGALAFGTGPELFQASLRTVIIRETSSGTLDFYYQVVNPNPSASIQLIETIGIAGFAGFTADAEFRSDLDGAFVPMNAVRSADGDSITFTGFPYLAGIFLPAGDATATLLIRTDATVFSNTGLATINFIDTQSNAGIPPISGAATVATYAPTAVPEPGTLLLLGSGACLLPQFRTNWQTRRRESHR